ncbi:MAG: YfhO family protein, partial [Lachnospiraceae bacterium]|nr:YfhO family protein [Lachnospiraceae bacterium]
YFLQKLGYNDDGLYTDFGHDNTFTADSLLAIKYLVGADGYRDGYEKLSDLGGGVYKNPYALSAACLADRLPQDSDLRAFRLQERIYDDINGKENHIFLNDIFYSQIFAKDGLSYTCHMCKAACDGYVYLYIDDIEDYSQNLSVYEEDRMISGYGNSGSYKILNLGYHKKGELFDIYVRSDSKDANFGTAYIVSEDINALKESYEEAKTRDCEVIRYSSSRFEIKVPQNIDLTGSSGIMTSFPYEKGWKVKINGRKIEPECIYEAFMFIPLKDTDKDVIIQMSYHPEGMAEGAIITLIAVIGIVLLNIIDRRKL